MKSIIVKFGIMIGICLTFLAYVEFRARVLDNTMLRKKKDIITKFGDNIDGFILGPSHLQRAINPELMDGNVASLAIPGSALNVDYLLWKSVVKNRSPKYIVIGLPIGYLEKTNSSHWISYRKIPYYFDIDTRFAIKDLFLTHYPLWPYINGKAFKSEYSDYGFEKNISLQQNDFAKINYDESKMLTTPRINRVFNLNDYQNKSNNNSNRKRLIEIIEHSAQNNIPVFLISAPKYHLYNDMINEYHIEQREDFLKGVHSYKNVQFWEFSELYENDATAFFNLNHAMPSLAIKFTKVLNDSIQKQLDVYD